MGPAKTPQQEEKARRVLLDARAVVPLGVACAFVGIVWVAASAWTGRETEHVLERTLNEKRFEAAERITTEMRAAIATLLSKQEFREWLNSGPRVLLPKELRDAFPEAPK